jgi:hypothetical protein
MQIYLQKLINEKIFFVKYFWLAYWRSLTKRAGSESVPDPKVRGGTNTRSYVTNLELCFSVHVSYGGTVYIIVWEETKVLRLQLICQITTLLRLNYNNNTQSTTVSVPSSELGPPIPHLPQASGPPPQTKGGGATLACGWGRWRTQFGRLERNTVKDFI